MKGLDLEGQRVERALEEVLHAEDLGVDVLVGGQAQVLGQELHHQPVVQAHHHLGARLRVHSDHFLHQRALRNKLNTFSNCT